jgi:DMSO/TMAO reductase YedYZ molybdopterin-dependent catalytic subunit
VLHEAELAWNAFQALASTSEVADFHFVTQWSTKAEPRYMMLRGSDGYTPNLNLETQRDPEVLFANKIDGEPLDPSHCYPVRLVVPARYG